MAADGAQRLLIGGQAEVALDAVAPEAVAAGQHAEALLDALGVARADSFLADEACSVFDLESGGMLLRGSVRVLFDVGSSPDCSTHGDSDKGGEGEGDNMFGCDGGEKGEAEDLDEK